MTDTTAIDKVRELIDEMDFEEALEAAEAIEGAEGALLRVEILLGLEETERALEAIEPFATDDQDDAQVHAMMGLCLYYMDEVEEAREVLNHAQKLDGANIVSLHTRAMVYRDLDFERASTLDLDKAQMLLEGDDDRRDELAETYSIRAGFAIEDGELADAERHLRGAATAYPEDTEYLLDLARLLSVQNRTDEAIATCEEVVAADELCIEAHLLKSQLLYLSGRLEDAIANTEATLEIDDEEPYTIIQLATFRSYEGSFKVVLGLCDRAIELDPEIVDGYQLKAAALQKLGRVDEITGDIMRNQSESPDLPGYIYGERIDPYELAQGALEQAVSMEPAELKAIMEQMFDSGQLPEALRPMIEMTIENLPSIMEQIPAMTGMTPQELLAQMQTQTSVAGPADIRIGPPEGSGE